MTQILIMEVMMVRVNPYHHLPHCLYICSYGCVYMFVCVCVCMYVCVYVALTIRCHIPFGFYIFLGFSIFNELAKSKGKGIKRRSKFKSSKKKKPSPSIFKVDSDDDESDMKNSSDEDGDGDGDEYDNDRKIDLKDTKKDITPAISKQTDDLIDEEAQKVIHSGVDSMDGISKKKSTAKIDLTLVEKETKMYQALLDRLSRPSTDEAIISTSSKFAISDVDIIARTRNRATSHSCLQNLPTVQTQLQRRQIASASLASCDIGGDVEGTVQGEVLNFVTKLNGNLIHHWQIGSKEPFTKV